MLAATNTSNGISFIIPLLLMVAIFYFLLIRPQQRRVRQQRDLIQSLEVGDEILTIGGLFGTIRGIDDEALIVEIAPGTTIRLLKSAVARVLVDEEEDIETEDEEASGTT